MDYLESNLLFFIVQGLMHCSAYVTGERYNIHGIRNYLISMPKYQVKFMPEGNVRMKSSFSINELNK